jgi:hypothetical protein
MGSTATDITDPPKIDIFDIPEQDYLMNLHAARFRHWIEKGKTPSEAAGMLEGRAVTVRQFLMQNFELIEKRDKDVIHKATKHYARMNIGAVVGGLVANIAMRPLTNGRIFDWHVAARFGIRSSLFAVPLGFTLFHSWHYYTRLSLYIEDKYGDRIAKFMRTGDPSTINPDFVDPYGDFHR